MLRLKALPGNPGLYGQNFLEKSGRVHELSLDSGTYRAEILRFFPRQSQAGFQESVLIACWADDTPLKGFLEMKVIKGTYYSGAAAADCTL